MNVSAIVPPVEHTALFDLYSLNRIVDCCGCYCLTNASGEILYVGQAASVRQRVIQHFNSSKRDALTKQGRISHVWWRSAPTTSVSALERGWLEAIRLQDGNLPPLNQVGGPL